MIEPPPVAEPPIRGGNPQPQRDSHRVLNGHAANHRAAQLVNDLQQILLFADREFNRPPSAASDATLPAADRELERPPAAADVRRDPDTAAPMAPPLAPERDFASPVPDLDSTRRESAPTRGIHSRTGRRLGGSRERLVRNAPWLFSQTFVALIAVELARVSVTLIGGSQPLAPLPLAALHTGAHERSVVDVHSIVAAKLFGVFAADPSSQDPGGEALPAANLLLAGTLATENPKTGLAIISDTGPAEVYRVGASVGGASLDSVYRDRVILNRNGYLETLVLPKPVPRSGAATPSGPAPRAVAHERHGQRRDMALNSPADTSPAE